jgi:Xaa-Pro dipeptidase
MGNSMKRIKTFQKMIEASNLSGALLFYSRDIFYYTGTAQPSYLFITPQHYCLYVRSGLDFALREARIEKERIKEERSFKNILKELSPLLRKGQKIGTELDLLPANRFLEFSERFGGAEWFDVSPLILTQRQSKDSSEIKAIRKACHTIHQGHQTVLSVLKEGMSELELAASIEDAHRRAGHEGIFFIRQPDFFMSRGPLASGPNLYQISGVVYSITGVGLGPSVPLGPSRRRIKKGDCVVVDIPVLVEGYHADQTRTYVVGKAKAEAKNLFNSLKEIANFLIENLRPGMKSSEVYQMAMKEAKEFKVENSFLNFGHGRRARMIGHGVGLEVNEPPILSSHDDSEILESSVLALEMHMMDEKVGVVKLEDMILIGKNKNRLLTRSPRRLFEVE